MEFLNFNSVELLPNAKASAVFNYPVRCIGVSLNQLNIPKVLKINKVENCLTNFLPISVVYFP